MALVIGHVDIQGVAYYGIEYQVLEQRFSCDPLKDPRKTLEIIGELKNKGFHPQISMTVDFPNSYSHYNSLEAEEITSERLERIIAGEEKIPSIQHPQILDSGQLGRLTRRL